jgi:hypothetical protein
VETGRRIGDLSLLSRRPGEIDAGQAELARGVSAALAAGTLLDLPERGFDLECLDRLALAFGRSAAHRGTRLPVDLVAFLEEEFGESRLQSTQYANWCRNNAGRLLYEPPGTRMGEDRTTALAALVEGLRPELAAVSSPGPGAGSRPA